LESNPEAEPVENPAWTWQPLTMSDSQGVPLAAGGRALLRVVWNNRRGAGESLNLHARVWARAAGQKQDFALKIGHHSAGKLQQGQFPGLVSDAR
jgi:hypothetical protein